MSTTIFNVPYVHVNCAVCGELISIRETYEKILRITHADFFCVKGHVQSFQEQTEVDRLKKQLECSQNARNIAYERQTKLHLRIRALKGVVTRLRGRK